MVKPLQARFDPIGRRELHRSQLRNRRQKSTESMVQLADKTQRLVDKVYGDLPVEIKKRMAHDHFLDALSDGDYPDEDQEP